MSEEKTIICYMRVNSKDQLLNPDEAEVYTPSDVKTKRVWRARATGKTYPCPPWDRETEHLKNVAKAKGLGTYKVNSPERRMAVKEWWAEFDRANRITREEFLDEVRKVLTAEYKWNGRVRITKDGLQDIVRK